MGHFTYLRPQVLRVFEVKARVPELVVLVVLQHHQFLPVQYRCTLISTTNILVNPLFSLNKKKFCSRKWDSNTCLNSRIFKVPQKMGHLTYLGSQVLRIFEVKARVPELVVLVVLQHHQFLPVQYKYTINSTNKFLQFKHRTKVAPPIFHTLRHPCRLYSDVYLK